MYKVLLFGTGSSSYRVKSVLNSKKTELIGYLDNNKSVQGTLHYGLPVFAPDKVLLLQYDYIIIASVYYDEINDQLNKLEVPLDRIINIYKHLQLNSFKRIMEQFQERNQEEIRGFITGMSYSQYGYCCSSLKIDTHNFSLNSQDLFFDFCIAEFLLESKKITSFEYAFIGLAYFSFHFDLLLSRERNLVSRYYPLESSIRNLSTDKYHLYTNVMKSCFNTEFEPSKHHFLYSELFIPGFIEFINKLENNIPQESLKDRRKKLAVTHSSKNYPVTVGENEYFFDKYINLLKKHSIKPIVIIHPQELNYRQHFSKRMIDEFYNIISKFSDEIRIIDLFDSDQFNENDFFDLHHLNSNGAQKVSRIINQYI